MTSPARAEPPAEIVFAAASLKNALDGIDEEWHREIGKSVTAAYAASSTLAKQIENGAPADLFISADPEWMDYLEQRKQIRSGSRSNLLGNSLVLVRPAGRTVPLPIASGRPLPTAL